MKGELQISVWSSGTSGTLEKGWWCVVLVGVTSQNILFEGLLCIETLIAPSKAAGIVCNKVTGKLSQSPIVTVPTLGVIVPDMKVKCLLQQQSWRTVEELFQCKFCFLTDSAAHSHLWFRNFEVELGVDAAAFLKCADALYCLCAFTSALFFSA